MGNCYKCICTVCSCHNGIWCECEKVSFFYNYHCQHCKDTGRATRESVYKCPGFKPKDKGITKEFAIKNQITWLLN